MDILKTAIFTACIIGIISSLTDMAAPNGALKKQLKMILTMILILGVFTPFLREGFKLDINAVDDMTKREEYESINEDFRELYLKRASENIEQVIGDMLEEQGVEVKKISINSQLDEYNALEIKNITVYLKKPTQSDKDKAAAVINENIPETTVEFAGEDDIEY